MARGFWQKFRPGVGILSTIMAPPHTNPHQPGGGVGQIWSTHNPLLNHCEFYCFILIIDMLFLQFSPYQHFGHNGRFNSFRHPRALLNSPEVGHDFPTPGGRFFSPNAPPPGQILAVFFKLYFFILAWFLPFCMFLHPWIIFSVF